MKNLLLIQPRLLLKRVYPKAVWNLSRVEKTIYITFDDGPIPGLTEWVLDELKKHQAKATFFCVGANILKHESIFKRIQSEGHTVANHTMFHIKGFKHSVNDYMAEVNDCERLVGTKLFRPPYGQLKKDQYRALIQRGYKIVMWDVISYDYETIPEKKVLAKVIDNTKNGSIVLFHDNLKAEKNMKYALPLFLKQFSEKGYTFKALGAI